MHNNRLISQKIRELSKQLDQLGEKAWRLLNSNKQTNPNTLLPKHFQRQTPTIEPGPDKWQVINITDNQSSAWDSFAKQHPESNVYQLYAFRSIIKNSFGHSTYYLAAINEDKEIVGILPSVHINSRLFGNYMVAMPFFNYGGALGQSTKVEQLLMDALNTRAASLGVSHVEYRDTVSRPGLPQKSEKASMVLRLPDQPEKLWQDIGSKVRAQIKKAESFSLTFHLGGMELLEDFYHVFSINMRDLGTPVYGKSLFTNLLQNKDLEARIAIVRHQGKPVSAGFLLGYKSTQEIPWASTLRTANLLNANMFLYWNILKSAIESGFEYFDFGRSTKDAGTFKFKQQWGAKPCQLHWHYWLQNGKDLPQLNPNNPKFRLIIALWQRMPVWITKIIGPFLVKNLP